MAEPPIDDGLNMKFRTRLDEPKVPSEEPSSRAQMSTINAQLLAEIEAAKSSIRNARCPICANTSWTYECVVSGLEKPQVEVTEQVDVSDVNPFVALASSVVTVVVASFLWQFTTFLSVSFAEHPFQSDFYPVERLAGAIRLIVVGASSLVTGLTAIVGIGVGILGLNVALNRPRPPATSDQTTPFGGDVK